MGFIRPPDGQILTGGIWMGWAKNAGLANHSRYIKYTLAHFLKEYLNTHKESDLQKTTSELLGKESAIYASFFYNYINDDHSLFVTFCREKTWYLL